ENAVGPGRGQEVGDKLGRDGDSPLVLAVLAGVAVVGQDDGDAGRAGPLERVQDDQQLHQGVVHRRAGRLEDENVTAADVLVDPDGRLAVREAVDLEVAETVVELAGNPLGEGRVGAPGEDAHLVVEHV